MLKKLLKYDLGYMLKNMLIFYSLSVISAVLTRIFFSLKQTTFVAVVGRICVGLMFSMIFSTVINTIIRSWVRFRAVHYGDESYLYHTLPVSRKDLFEAKFVGSIIFTVVGFAVCVVSLLIAYASESNFERLREFLKQTSGALDIDSGLLLSIAGIALFIEIVNAIQSGFTGIILGNRKQDRRMLYSFIFGFGFYLLTQVCVVLFVLFIGLFNQDIMSIFTTNSLISQNTLMNLSVYVVATYCLIIIGTNILSVNLFNKKVNVE